MNPSCCYYLATWLLIGLTLVALLPSTILLIEIVAAFLPRRLAKNEPTDSPRMAILVPAHDEAIQIKATVDSLKSELGPNDRLIVIADNCQDDTAEKARLAGALVIERNDPQHRGKGFAISFGVAYLQADPPDVVVLMDADCQIALGHLHQLAKSAWQLGKPVQADYLLTAPDSTNQLSSINALAVLVRNRVRPLGLQQLAKVCQLTGSGMAFPWSVLRDAPPMQENLVEDLALGLELSMQDRPPQFFSHVRIVSPLPTSNKAGIGQRRRWEHGQLHTMKRYIPRLLSALLRKPQRSLLGLALDLLVPPLTLLVLIQTIVLAITAIAVVLGISVSAPFFLATTSFTILCLAIGLAWIGFGRQTLSLASAVRIPLYMVWKIGLYASLFFKGKQKSWERTERLPPPPKPPLP